MKFALVAVNHNDLVSSITFKEYQNISPNVKLYLVNYGFNPYFIIFPFFVEIYLIFKSYIQFFFSARVLK